MTKKIAKSSGELLRSELRKVVQLGAGATLTKKGRDANLAAFFKTLRSELNIQVKSFSSLTTKHLQAYANHLKKTLSSRTIQNKITHIRVALRAAGRQDFADLPQNSNTGLGVEKASRNGTHRPAQEAVNFFRISELPPAHQACANLQTFLGLRVQEALMSGKSLASWQHQLEQTGCLKVIHGTKGGRPRTLDLRGAQCKENALEVILVALKLLHSGNLIQSLSIGGAIRSYQRAMNKVGFKGEQSSHSLRCAWSQARFLTLLEETGGHRAEALALLSMELGHGDGRGTWAEKIYLKNEPLPID